MGAVGGEVEVGEEVGRLGNFSTIRLYNL